MNTNQFVLLKMMEQWCMKIVFASIFVCETLVPGKKYCHGTKSIADSGQAKKWATGTKKINHRGPHFLWGWSFILIKFEILETCYSSADLLGFQDALFFNRKERKLPVKTNVVGSQSVDLLDLYS